jgi:hypothetical protein
MVNAAVEAQHLSHERAFFGTPGNADNACARPLSKLSGDRTHGPGGGGDHNRLARPRPADILHPRIGCGARQTEHAEIGRGRHAGRDRNQVIGGRYDMALPTTRPDNNLARHKTGVI